ncbi:hypothetical protein Dimus_012278 [Dionaea muscipula]
MAPDHHRSSLFHILSFVRIFGAMAIRVNRIALIDCAVLCCAVPSMVSFKKSLIFPGRKSWFYLITSSNWAKLSWWWICDYGSSALDLIVWLCKDIFCFCVSTVCLSAI